VASKKEYFEWLHQGTLVVSTACQENFGISVVEAIRCGCYPLLPHRLSYPEIVPRDFHHRCLYRSRDELVDGLARALAAPETLKGQVSALSRAMEAFSWSRRITQWDLELERLGRHASRP
jgi:glycosyltransferase involved in cell wall biosynthesis